MRSLVEAGLLHPKDKAESAWELVTLGFDRALFGLKPGETIANGHTRTVLGRFDDEVGDSVNFFLNASGSIGVHSYSHAIYTRLRMHRIMDRIGMGTKAAAWAASVINHHRGFGSTDSWEEIISECGGGTYDRATGDFIDADEGKEGAKDSVRAQRIAWFAKFKKDHPWLFQFQYSKKQTLIDVFTRDLKKEASDALRHIKHRDPKLADIFEALGNATGKFDYIQDPYAVLTWTKDDPTEHAWDYVCHCYQEGYYDASQEALVDFCADSISDLKLIFGRIETWLQPVEALVKWAYRAN